MEISKAEVMRRLYEAGYRPDPEPKQMLPEPKGLAAEEIPGADTGPSFTATIEYAKPKLHDPKGEPWMIWVRQHWATQEQGPHGHQITTTHLKFAAAKNQQSYRTEGHWEMGIAIQGTPAPEELIYAVERELSAAAGYSIRVSHLDGRPVA
jgi:hypothetical protein